MAGKRLVLHIGTHKTGSSSFQRSLQRNAGALIDRGVRPLRERIPGREAPPLRRANATGIAHLFLRPELQTGARIRGEVPALTQKEKAQRRAALAARIARMDEETVLISAEVFCFLRTEDEQESLRAFVAATGRRVETLAVFRNDAEWRKSWADQLAKDARVSRALDEAADGPGHDLRGEWIFDRGAIRGFWAPFGLREIDYDACPNIVAALYGALGIDPEGLAIDFRLNRRRPGDREGAG